MTFQRLSADGQFAGPDGGLDWVVPDDEIDKAGAQGASGTGTILFGRRTYEQFEAFWPHALDDSPDPHHPGRRSPAMRAMADWINEATKLVFSRTLKDVTWRNSRLLRELDPVKVEALKREPGEDMMLFGSGSIVSQLTEHGLIDEYMFVVSPVLLGNGRPLFSDVSRRSSLDLLEVREYQSGNVWLRYAHAD